MGRSSTACDLRDARRAYSRCVIGRTNQVKSSFDHNSQMISIELTPSGSGKSYRATVADRTVDIEIIHSENGNLDLLIDGKRLTAYVSSDNTKHWVTIHGQTFVLTKSSGARKGRHGLHHVAGELTAPMPGQVR